jgi:uncharacterized integral membrane protein (TIGR00698 family)
MICAVIAMAATFLSDHYGGPQLLYALLMGLALHFLMEQPKIKPGIDFCARTLLRVGVALLGMRITVSQVIGLGLSTAMVVAGALVATIGFGLLLARWIKRPASHGLLSGGAVAICGASAALAISSVLPQTRDNERFTLLTVVAVTVLSTLAMVLYPFALSLLELEPKAAGIVIGGTIHDVAQVVAAGMLMGNATAEVATVVKLFRVILLMPVVLMIAVAYRNHPDVKSSDESVPLIPGFLLAFIALVLFASMGVFTPPMTQLAGDASRTLLVTAIAAAGIKTTFEDLLKLGWQPVVMLVSETLFIAAVVTAAVYLLA